VVVVAVALLLSPAPLVAGGLPRVCLPVDGVTADNAKACAKLIADALPGRAERVEQRENGKQWYALFSLNAGELDLVKLEAALKAGRFTIPRDKLRPFGEVVLEVEVGAAADAKVLADLKAIKNLTVTQSNRAGGVQVVTAVVPFPPHTGREVDDFGKEPFEKLRFGVERSDFAPQIVPPAGPRDLPVFADLRAAIEKHNGALKGMRWKLLGCHVQGGVVASDAK
jgi:hypothetical protein